MEPPIKEEDESERDESHTPNLARTPVARETPQECATRLRRIVQSGEYRHQYQALAAVQPRSGHTSARLVIT